MDRIRHGKRPLPSDEREEGGGGGGDQEDNNYNMFRNFSSSRAEHDASAMVSALAHVISSDCNQTDQSGAAGGVPEVSLPPGPGGSMHQKEVGQLAPEEQGIVSI